MPLLLRVGFGGLVFVCAKPMSDLTLLSGLHHFCPRNWRSTLLSSVGRLYAFIVLVDAAAGRVTGRIFNVDSDDYSLREIRGGISQYKRC